eukprot:tig00000128_g7210.t1
MGCSCSRGAVAPYPGKATGPATARTARSRKGSAQGDLAELETHRQEVELKVSKTRVVRVFVSSTFRDMKEDRDALNAKCFPAMRALCAQRGLLFVSIDLRWGVTAADTENNLTIQICLDEIDKCRPYFVGILGMRYGWAQQTDGSDALLAATFKHAEKKSKYKWLKKYRDRSVTELEIIYAALDQPKKDTYGTFFYFRAPDYRPPGAEGMSADELAGYRDTDAWRLERLAALKQRIRDSDFPVYEPYGSVGELAERLRSDLEAVIVRDFPEATQPTPLERERQAHEAFAEMRRRVYVGRSALMAQLDRLVEEEGPPVCVLGEAGAGKSAFIANWVHRYRSRRPKDFIFIHFIGGSNESASHVKLARRLLASLEDAFPGKLEAEAPKDADEAVRALPDLLIQAAAALPRPARICLVLDALDQLEEAPGASSLAWLPKSFPRNARLVVSTLPGRALEATRERGFRELRVEPLAEPEQREMIREYLGQYGKRLEEGTVERIVGAPQARNALYLRTLLEEMRIFGDFEKVAEKLESYLAAATVTALYDAILHRWEGDFKELPDVMRLVAVSRYGLTEEELMSLLALPAARWSPLHSSIADSMVVRSGCLNFFHKFIAEAVAQRYLRGGQPERLRVHRLLADFFQRQPMSERRVQELPYHLASIRDMPRLADCLSDLEVFSALYKESTVFELWDYWRRVGEAASLVECYRRRLDEFERRNAGEPLRLANLLVKVGQFIDETGKYDQVMPFYERSLGILRSAPGGEVDRQAVAAVMSEMAKLQCRLGRTADAVPLFEQSLAMAEETFGGDHEEVAFVLNNLGTAYQELRDYDRAIPLFQRALAIYEGRRGAEDPSVARAVANLALVYSDQSRYEEALASYSRALRIWEEALGKEHPEVASVLNNMALMYHSEKKYGEAVPLYLRSLRIKEAYLGREHPSVGTAYNNLGLVYKDQERYEEALGAMRRALDIWRASFGDEHPDVALAYKNIGNLHKKQQQAGPGPGPAAAAASGLTGGRRWGAQIGEALEAYKASLRILQKLHGPEHPNVRKLGATVALLVGLVDRARSGSTLSSSAAGLTLNASSASIDPGSPGPLSASSNTLNTSVASDETAPRKPPGAFSGLLATATSGPTPSTLAAPAAGGVPASALLNKRASGTSLAPLSVSEPSPRAAPAPRRRSRRAGRRGGGGRALPGAGLADAHVARLGERLLHLQQRPTPAAPARPVQARTGSSAQLPPRQLTPERERGGAARRRARRRARGGRRSRSTSRGAGPPRSSPAAPPSGPPPRRPPALPRRGRGGARRLPTPTGAPRGHPAGGVSPRADLARRLGLQVALAAPGRASSTPGSARPSSSGGAERGAPAPALAAVPRLGSSGAMTPGSERAASERGPPGRSSKLKADAVRAGGPKASPFAPRRGSLVPLPAKGAKR